MNNKQSQSVKQPTVLRAQEGGSFPFQIFNIKLRVHVSKLKGWWADYPFPLIINCWKFAAAFNIICRRFIVINIYFSDMMPI